MIFRSLGESTLLIEWPSAIDHETLRQIIHLESQLKEKSIPGLLDFNHAYHSLAISFDTDQITFDELKTSILEFSTTPGHCQKKTLWEIPVCYDPIYGLDMDAFCQAKKLSPDDVVQIHSSTIYTIYFLGFLPGFMYMGGLDKRLHLPRKANPDRAVPKGAVAIGGNQTGIYPTESPGGWHVIGNSPIDLFDSTQDPPCFVRPGDQLQFVPVSKNEYDRIAKESFKLKNQTIDG